MEQGTFQLFLGAMSIIALFVFYRTLFCQSGIWNVPNCILGHFYQ